jgi:hypothetical protein
MIIRQVQQMSNEAARPHGQPQFPRAMAVPQEPSSMNAIKGAQRVASF